MIAVAGGGVESGHLYVCLYVHWLSAANSSLQLNLPIIASDPDIRFSSRGRHRDRQPGLSPALALAARVPPGIVMKDWQVTATLARSRLQERFIVAQVALTQPFLLAVCLMLTQVVPFPQTGKRIRRAAGCRNIMHRIMTCPVGRTANCSEVERQSACPPRSVQHSTRFARSLACWESSASTGIGCGPRSPWMWREVREVPAEYRTIQPG